MADQQQSRYAEIVARAWSDPAFKERLLANPQAVLAQAGIRPPAGAQFRIVEDTDAVINLVLPCRPAGPEMSDQELEAIAGGRFPYSAASHQDVCCA